ncbi:MAG: DUF4450 domain-containing protein [Verrucomicrobiota bacterium]
MIRRFLLLHLIFWSSICALAQDKDNVPGVLEGGAIVRRNGVFYNNRPLYGGHGNPQSPYYWVFAGDRPFLRFGGSPWIDGCFMLGFQKAGGSSKWLLDFKSIEARYHGGRMEWVASDPEFPGVSISLHGLPLSVGFGMAAQAQVTGATAGDRLVWMFGAANRRSWVNDIDALAVNSQQVRYEGFDAAQAEGDRIEVKDGVIRLEPPRASPFRYTLTACSAPSEIRVGDADQWKTPSALLASTGGKRPIACGITPIAGQEPIKWICRVWSENETAAAAPNVVADFRAAWDRVESLRNRVVSNTPDPRFDFMVRAATPALDSLWRTTAYGHGCLSAFPHPLLGWRSTYGGVAYGWPERVLTAARTFFASQVTGESYLDHPELRKLVDQSSQFDLLKPSLSHPGRDPRFFSKGRLIPNGNSMIYDMQSQFVDSIIEGWRFTADPEMEKVLRPALELHLGYIDRSFDPDGDGTYETFINTYLTDNVWFNGGGTPDETAFAWRGHLAARDMARRAGDMEAVKRHEAKLALIRKGFFEKLWVANAGHPGAYREQGGNERLHPDPWLPGVYLPLDCPGLLNSEQAASSLHFTEYGLQREQRPSGGVRVWCSNWVPGIWSIRLKSPGDEYALALGYCFAGLPEGGFEIVRGCNSEGAFESAVPGNLGLPYGNCGTDFGDCLSSFARTVVSGVFGYRPDRPNELVTIAPQFPAAWDHATFKHPEFKLAYQRQGATERLSVELERESAMELEIPFHGTAVKSATLNGTKVNGRIKPGFGRSIYVLRTPLTKKAVVELEIARELPAGVAQSREAEAGSKIELAVEGGRITEIRDAQGVLVSPKIAGGKVNGRVSNNVGNHRLLALVEMGHAPQWRIFDFLISNHKAEQAAAEKNLCKAPADAKWTEIDLSGQLNGRVTDVFRQEYLSPRPDTISLRLAKDGYQTWQSAISMCHPAPGIDFSNTRPMRPAAVYDASVESLKLGGDFTIEAWVRADIMPPWTSVSILSMGDLVIDTERTTAIRVQLGSASWGLEQFLCGERDTHIAIVCRAGKQAQVSIDGKLYYGHTKEVNLSPLSLGPTLRIGADPKGDKRLLGWVDRVAISSQAATMEQLKSRPVNAEPLPGTVADWRIPESAGAEVASAVAGGPVMARKEYPYTPAKNQPERLKVADGMLQVPQGACFKWSPGAKDIAFTSLWDNWPRKVQVPVNKKGDAVWLMVCGSTNPMQVRIANAVLRFEYADGVKEELELVNPTNFWSLCPFQQASDYDYRTEAFSLPKEAPPQVQLGNNCRAMVYGWKLRPDVELKQVTLESLSQEVVIGLMGLSVMNAK